MAPAGHAGDLRCAARGWPCRAIAGVPRTARRARRAGARRSVVANARMFRGGGAGACARDRRARARRHRGQRMDSPYMPGRRSRAWIKTKHRRREDLVVTALREATHTRRAELLVARRGADGMLGPAVAVAMGVTPELIDALDVAGPTGRGIARLRAPLTVAVDCHGRPDGPVRDAILRGLLPDSASTAL